MALVWKVRCVGLTFDKAADEIFNGALSSANGSTRIDIVFDIFRDESIKNVERNRRCSDTLPFKKIVGTNVIRQWNSFLGDKDNKNSLAHFLVNNWREYTMPVNKVIYATIGDISFASMTQWTCSPCSVNKKKLYIKIFLLVCSVFII